MLNYNVESWNDLWFNDGMDSQRRLCHICYRFPRFQKLFDCYLYLLFYCPDGNLSLQVALVRNRITFKFPSNQTIWFELILISNNNTGLWKRKFGLDNFFVNLYSCLAIFVCFLSLQSVLNLFWTGTTVYFDFKVFCPPCTVEIEFKIGCVFKPVIPSLTKLAETLALFSLRCVSQKFSPCSKCLPYFRLFQSRFSSVNNAQ